MEVDGPREFRSRGVGRRERVDRDVESFLWILDSDGQGLILVLPCPGRAYRL